MLMANGCSGGPSHSERSLECLIRAREGFGEGGPERGRLPCACRGDSDQQTDAPAGGGLAQSGRRQPRAKDYNFRTRSAPEDFEHLVPNSDLPAAERLARSSWPLRVDVEYRQLLSEFTGGKEKCIVS
jgi:hypothetical protein